MKSSLARIRLGALVLGIVFLVAVLGYRFFGEYPWPEAVWMVVVTVAGVGFSERSELPAPMQLFTVAVILFGMTAAAYTFGGFIQLVLEGEIDRHWGQQRMTKEIDRLNGHTVLCGYGRTGQILAEDLERNNTPFVVLETDAARVAEAREKEFLCLHGDATDDEILISAGIPRAKALLTALPSDAANVFITLTARNLNRDLLIVARAEHPATERKLRQAGADRVVLPSTIGAKQMSRIVTRPSTADILELLAETGNLNLELDEFRIAAGAGLVGKTVRETEAHRQFGLLLLAVKQAHAGMIFNPPAEYELQVGDVVVLMGPAEKVEQFRKVHQL
jgi:voltage-gated potassium channel